MAGDGEGGNEGGEESVHVDCNLQPAVGLEPSLLVALLRQSHLSFLRRALVDSMAQLSPFEAGQVKARIHHGLGPAEISRLVIKSNGKSAFSHIAFSECIARLAADPLWRVERAQGSGRPRGTTKMQDTHSDQMELKWRGRVKVTVAW